MANITLDGTNGLTFPDGSSIITSSLYINKMSLSVSQVIPAGSSASMVGPLTFTAAGLSISFAAAGSKLVVF
jgi:hypothetical protein